MLMNLFSLGKAAKKQPRHIPGRCDRCRQKEWDCRCARAPIVGRSAMTATPAAAEKPQDMAQMLDGEGGQYSGSAQ